MKKGDYIVFDEVFPNMIFLVLDKIDNHLFKIRNRKRKGGHIILNTAKNNIKITILRSENVELLFD